ncbi:hypothetical protein OIV19_18285 [Brucella sp. HL-2]|nr:hypothetical protein [Brucella sp. HL-2]MCV9909552.1 hypothetical protein [Brucella sp. HL-2]
MSGSYMNHQRVNYETVVDWRWTSQPLSFYGVHISITAFFPLFLLSVHFFSIIMLSVFFVAYLVFLLRCKSRKMTPFEYAQMLFVRFVYRRRWGAR